MAAIKVSVDLEGQKIAQEKLDAIYIQRARFTLQEMKNLGASILNTAFTELTTAEIAQIPDKQISQLLLANKLRLGKNRLNNLYADQYAQADQMWQKMIQDSIPGDFSQKVARAHLVVTGINWRSAYQLIKKAFSLKQTLLSIEPDHIDASGVTVTEIMGMYGKPTAMKGTLLNVPHPEPVKKDHYLRLLWALPI